MKKLALLLLLPCIVFAQSVPVKGAISTTVTQDNIQSTICVSGYTKTIRPPASYTNKLKLAQMKQLGLAGVPSDYEEDHLISLELGGSPTSVNNLWPQPWVNAHMKDAVENKLHKMVCTGKMTLAEAQKEISEDWYQAYLKYVKK